MVKGWGGVVGGSRFKSQWGQKFTHKKKEPMVDNAIYCFLLDQLIITSMI